MSGRLFYVSGTGGVRVPLDGPGAFSGAAEGLRGRSWSYSLGARSLSGASRKARECELAASFTDFAVADLLRRAADRDMATGTPGRMEMDGWSQRAYVVAFEPSSVSRRLVSATLTVALLDGAWRKPVTQLFRPLGDDPAEEWLDAPFDLPCDLLPATGDSAIESASWLASPAEITVWGPASSPELAIGGNVYAFDIDVPEGSRLVVDGASWPRSITMVSELGDRTDCFSCGDRGGGLGSGRYCFEPVPAGRSKVRWEGGFGFDVTYYIEEGEPPWSSS